MEQRERRRQIENNIIGTNFRFNSGLFLQFNLSFLNANSIWSLCMCIAYLSLNPFIVQWNKGTYCMISGICIGPISIWAITKMVIYRRVYFSLFDTATLWLWSYGVPTTWKFAWIFHKVIDTNIATIPIAKTCRFIEDMSLYWRHRQYGTFMFSVIKYSLSSIFNGGG